jgi:preprotein translocase subunit SecE
VAKTKKQSKARSEKKPVRKQPNAIQRYLNETIGELRKVTWPTRKEATNLTIVVIIVSLSMSAFLGILDYIYTQIFKLIVG